MQEGLGRYLSTGLLIWKPRSMKFFLPISNLGGMNLSSKFFLKLSICYQFYTLKDWLIFCNITLGGFMGKSNENYINLHHQSITFCENSNFVTKSFMPFLSFLYEVHKVSMHQQKITIAHRCD